MTQKLNEVAPPGWGHTKAEKEKSKPNKPKSKIGGTADAMKQAQKRGDIPKNMNIFALMWSMKNKGDKPHYKPGVKGKLKGKYKGPEGQNEMIDPKKIRNYKNVSNAIVAKADKEAEKVKDKEQKGTLEFPQMPTEESKWTKNFKAQGAKRRGETTRRQQAGEAGQKAKPRPQEEGWGAVAKAADTLAAKSKAREDATKNKKVSSWVKNRKEDMSLAPKGKGKKAAKALYQDEDIDMVSLVAQAIKSLPEGEWADSKAQEKKDSDRLIAIHNEREKRYQAQQAAKKKAGAKKEGTEGDALVKAVANSSKQQALKKKQMLNITSAGKKALKKGDHKLSITPKGRAAIKDEVEVDETLDLKKIRAQKRAKDAGRMKDVEKVFNKKAKPTKDRRVEPRHDASIRGSDRGYFEDVEMEGRDAIKDDYVSNFGDKLRQAIAEAKKVNAIDTINKIVKTKTMGKIHNQQVDLFTASAIQQVYKALNKKNQEKMISVMSKDVHGLLKMADFSMKQMKR